MNKLILNLKGADTFGIKEAYKFFRTNIQFCGKDIKVISFTSCNENEGKSTTSLNVAKSFADMGKKTLVIDADMRKSVMASRNFGARNCYGLSEVLTGQKNVNECVYMSDIPNMFVLLAGSIPPNPAELLASKYFDALLKAFRESFDYIIIDTPPLGLVADAAIVATKCDGTILVIGSEPLNRYEAIDVVSTLKAGGAHILGAVRNNVSQHKKKRYGYGYGYGYDYQHDIHNEGSGNTINR